ncbi:MAG: aldehyde dehydrogenase family protein, partial [Pseudomonadota bacterium]
MVDYYSVYKRKWIGWIVMAKQHSREDWEKKAAALSFETQMFINGQYRDAKEGGRFETINPATGDVITSVSEGKSSDIEDAVAAARKAYRSGVWARKEPRERMRILYHFAELVEAHTEEFALLDTLDTGKPIVPALQGDIPLCASTIKYFAELIDKHEGLVTATRHDALHYVVRQPFGVVGLIVPWNFPLLMAVWKVAPALATGNSIVLKPAEQSPLSA